MVSYWTAFAMRVLWVVLTVMVPFWVNVPVLVFLRSVEILNFMILMRIDKGHWPRSLLWHGWLPLLSGTNDAFPWAESAAQGAKHFLEQVLGAYSSRLVFDWGLPDDIALQICEHPNVWTDGSFVLDEVCFLLRFWVIFSPSWA